MKDNIKLITSLGFGSVMLLMFVVVFIALAELKSLNRNMSTLVEETNAKIEAAATMRDAIRMRAISLQAMQLSDDPFFRDEQMIHFNSYAGIYRMARETLINTRMDARELEINERLTRMTRIAQPLNEYAADLLIEFAPIEEIKSAVRLASNHQQNILNTLNELVALEKSNAEQALRTSHQNYTETRRTLFILTVCALVFGALISILVIRHAARKNNKISYQACHDDLTGLLNRRAFESELKALVECTKKTDSRHALLYIDLDQFKIINDTCGHLAGDKLLCQLTTLFHKSLRKTDVIARLGGDEFGVLLKDCPMKAAVRIGENIRKSVAEHRFTWEQKSFSLGVSIGIVPIDAYSGNLTRVLSIADMACLHAKQTGRNRVHVAATDDREIANYLGEMEWVGRINEALEHGRFQLYFQKIIPISGSGKEAEHIEILIRMRGGDGKLIAPGAFIPAAERYNMMPAIDRWVILQVIHSMQDHPLQFRDRITMINLSGQSMCNEQFIGFVEQLLNSSTISPERICFEITETAAIANLTKARTFIEKLKERGYHFALDDFGSGLSSFSYLKELPVEYLKIDGAFVKDIVDDPIDFAMVRSINDIGHVMGKKTIAEFVENDAILEKLKSIGVDYAQGYGIAVPKPLSELTSPEITRKTQHALAGL